MWPSRPGHSGTEWIGMILDTSGKWDVTPVLSLLNLHCPRIKCTTCPHGCPDHGKIGHCDPDDHRVRRAYQTATRRHTTRGNDDDPYGSGDQRRRTLVLHSFVLFSSPFFSFFDQSREGVKGGSHGGRWQPILDLRSRSNGYDTFKTLALSISFPIPDPRLPPPPATDPVPTRGRRATPTPPLPKAAARHQPCPYPRPPLRLAGSCRGRPVLPQAAFDPFPGRRRRQATTSLLLNSVLTTGGHHSSTRRQNTTFRKNKNITNLKVPPPPLPCRIRACLSYQRRYTFLRACCANTTDPAVCYDSLFPRASSFEGNLVKVTTAATIIAYEQLRSFDAELRSLLRGGTGAGKLKAVLINEDEALATLLRLETILVSGRPNRCLNFFFPSRLVSRCVLADHPGQQQHHATTSPSLARATTTSAITFPATHHHLTCSTPHTSSATPSPRRTCASASTHKWLQAKPSRAARRCYLWPCLYSACAAVASAPLLSKPTLASCHPAALPLLNGQPPCAAYKRAPPVALHRCPSPPSRPAPLLIFYLAPISRFLVRVQNKVDITNLLHQAHPSTSLYLPQPRAELPTSTSTVVYGRSNPRLLTHFWSTHESARSRGRRILHAGAPESSRSDRLRSAAKAYDHNLGRDPGCSKVGKAT
ncbi:hypothetical protein HU200_001216 [Digitaria exilis]|uniref:Uncharacterized protein n=1 Tax=Digitaria exilis TaxID=1010633 RepID=A0A835G013_9POAL|nr:hypothetical protein HU200_001216 [Digitaria exilis]